MKNTFKELEINGDFFEIKDDQGNLIHGFMTCNKQGKQTSYVIVGAKFIDARFTKEKIRWKRDKKGQVSKAFYEWEEEAQRELYNQFFKPTHLS